MSTIGETIATLRKRQGMTQEALANLIGVSPQSISKWEGSVNMPDISLLPVLADIFRCRIDDFFGRGAMAKEVNPDKILDKCCDAVCQELGGCWCGDAIRWEEYDEAIASYKRKLKEDDNQRSIVMCAQGVVYYREKLGALLLKKPQEGWRALFDQEGLDEVLALAGDRDFRMVLAKISRSHHTSFTLHSLCSRCGIQEEAALKEKLEKSGLFWMKSVDVDDRQVTIYELTQTGKLSMLLAVLSYAAEYMGYRDCCTLFYGCAAEELLE